MPQYDFRCEACKLRFSVTYRSYADYDAASIACPECRSAELSRLITTVSVRRTGRDYGKLSSGEMLFVLESGDERQVNEMFKQIGGAAPAASTPRGRDESTGGSSSADPD